MDPISLIATIGVAVGAIAGLEKVKSFITYSKNKKNYENAFYIHKVVAKSWSKKMDLKKQHEVIKRIILSDKDLKNVEDVKKAYSYLSDEFLNINIKDLRDHIEKYEITSKYFEATMKSSSKEFAALSVALNSGLISSILQNILSSTDRNAIDRSTIIGMLVGNKISQDTKSYIFLLLALIAHGAFSLFGAIEVSPIIIGGILTLIGALSLNQKITEYRIKRGYYGSTAYEVREIIKFIEEHADKNDFNDGDGKKKLFQDAEESAPREEIVYGSVYQ